MKKPVFTRLLSIVAGFAVASAASLAHAADVRLGINIGIPAPVYVAPQPYYAPPPPPVVYQPAPVYVRPPVVIGWYGDRYYDGPPLLGAQRLVPATWRTGLRRRPAWRPALR